MKEKYYTWWQVFKIDLKFFALWRTIIFSSKIFNHDDMTSKLLWHLNQTGLVVQNCLSEESLLSRKEQNPALKKVSILNCDSLKCIQNTLSDHCLLLGERQEVGYQSLCNVIQWGQQWKDSRGPWIVLISVTAMVGWTHPPASWIQNKSKQKVMEPICK